MDNRYDLDGVENDTPHLPPVENGFSTDLKTRLMLGMLEPAAEESILDIGCGACASYGLLLEYGLRVTGVYGGPDIPPVIPAGIRRNRISLRRGKADELPFGDNHFNHACLMNFPTSAENPQKVLEEAFRVSKDRVFIGFLNRYAMAGIQRRVKGIFAVDEGPRIPMFSIWEIKRMIRDLLGPVPICWRTVGRHPAAGSHPTQGAGFFQRFPFGAFVGMVVTLIPRFRTRPLVLTYQSRTLHRTADCSTMTRFNGVDGFSLPAFFFDSMPPLHEKHYNNLNSFAK